MSVYAIFANTNTNVAVSQTQTQTKKIERHKKEQLNRKNILQLLFCCLFYFSVTVPVYVFPSTVTVTVAVFLVSGLGVVVFVKPLSPADLMIAG